MHSKFNIHGDNIVECNRMLRYVCEALAVDPGRLTGPHRSVTCPAYTLEYQGRLTSFQFLPGYGGNRWNQDVIGYIKHSGGRLREAPDAIITKVKGRSEEPLVAIEFCSALPRYNSTFGRSKFLEFLRLTLTGCSPAPAVVDLGNKCLALVKLLAESSKRKNGLTADQWMKAYEALRFGQSLPDYLDKEVRLPWKKKITVKNLTSTATLFMDLGAHIGFGLTAFDLPLCFVPKSRRTDFAKSVQGLYPDLSPEFIEWLATDQQALTIAWLLGFKPGGEDARPDRGLPPMARMLTGGDGDLLTFVYGPVPLGHWQMLTRDVAALTERNGLWEAILGASDGILIDSAAKPARRPLGCLTPSWTVPTSDLAPRLRVHPEVQSLGEQDVDTSLHIAFSSLGDDIAFEGLCNPPGGDWSGISFRWGSNKPEFRWLTLPRVSGKNGKRPDHVFGFFGDQDDVICLCIESKGKARSLETGIGPRLCTYVETLFSKPPSIRRDNAADRWAFLDGSNWSCPCTTFVSAGAYWARHEEPFRGLPSRTGLDVQIGVEFLDRARRCILHLRGDTELGRSFILNIALRPGWSELVTLQINS